MLNSKNHVLLVLSTADGNVVEMKANIVKFPYGKEKASVTDLSTDDVESIELTISSVEKVNKEIDLRNDVDGSVIDEQVGKTYTVGDFNKIVQAYNEDSDTPLDFSIPELNYSVPV